jgi:tetratricopeptide (TPR) repeat protein
MLIGALTAILATLHSLPSRPSTQGPLPALPVSTASLAEPDSALNACVAAGRTGDKRAAKASGEAADAHYRRLLAANPDDATPKVLLARVISQCRIESASLWSKEGLAKESNRLLSEVLSKDSTNWEARYTLALNYYHAPGFFGWTDNAIREFERLLAQQGDQALFPEQAKPYLYLGHLYDKKGRRADALALWRRGSRLFPEDAKLRERAAAEP